MYLFFDTETNGLPIDAQLSHVNINNWPRIVSIAWVLCDDERKIHEIEKYIIKPDGWVIPKSAVKVHGITTEQANAEGVEIEQVLLKFLAALQKANYVVGHNIRFDRNVVAAELYRYFFGKKFDEFLYAKPYRDTMHISRVYVSVPNKNKSGIKFPTLNEMYHKFYDTDIEDAHDSLVDIKATVMCFWKLFDLGLVEKFYLTHRDVSEKKI